MSNDQNESPSQNDPGTPGYKSRKMLATENEELKTGLAALMARIEALESRPVDTAVSDQILSALRQDREEVLSAKLQRELDDARRQIQDLQLQETPTTGVPYKGPVQARADCWDPVNGYKHGPQSPYAARPGYGDVFYVDMPDYWPGCPFVPVIIKGVDPGTGLHIVEPHPDFASH